MAGVKAGFTVTAVPAPGRMAVDWEERVDYRRLHEYRLGRARDAIARHHGRRHAGEQERLAERVDSGAPLNGS